MKHLKHFTIALATMAFSTYGGIVGGADVATSEHGNILPGQQWRDTDGIPINAHGFCVLFHEETYYWYGSHKIAGLNEEEKNEAGVRCYVSRDLLNWRNAGLVLDVDAPGMHPEVARSFILDRPKVIYHVATKRFILYFKLYPPREQGGKSGKEVAYVGVATAPTPTGPFAYQHRFIGGGTRYGSGDFAMFQDVDRTVYHVCVRKPDKALCYGRLSDDGLKPAGSYTAMEGVERGTEAPVVFRRGNQIFLLGSGSTGWEPNPARLFVAGHIAGPYRSIGNPCQGVNPHNHMGPMKAFGGQSAFVLRLPGRQDAWIAMFDIWKPRDPIDSGYIWLPLQFDGEKPVVLWKDKWNLSWFGGK